MVRMGRGGQFFPARPPSLEDEQRYVPNAVHVITLREKPDKQSQGLRFTVALTAVGIWLQVGVARWVGLAIASLNAIVQLLFIPAYPFWSLTLFAVDMLVIYGLVVHGARDRVRGLKGGNDALGLAEGGKALHGLRVAD